MTIVFSKKKETVKSNVKRRLYMDIFWILLGGGPFFGCVGNSRNLQELSRTVSISNGIIMNF